MQGLTGHLEGSGLYSQGDESSGVAKCWGPETPPLSQIVE